MRNVRCVPLPKFKKEYRRDPRMKSNFKMLNQVRLNRFIAQNGECLGESVYLYGSWGRASYFDIRHFVVLVGGRLCTLLLASGCLRFHRLSMNVLRPFSQQLHFVLEPKVCRRWGWHSALKRTNCRVLSEFFRAATSNVDITDVWIHKHLEVLIGFPSKICETVSEWAFLAVHGSRNEKPKLQQQQQLCWRKLSYCSRSSRCRCSCFPLRHRLRVVDRHFMPVRWARLETSLVGIHFGACNKVAFIISSSNMSRSLSIRAFSWARCATPSLVYLRPVNLKDKGIMTRFAIEERCHFIWVNLANFVSIRILWSLYKFSMLSRSKFRLWKRVIQRFSLPILALFWLAAPIQLPINFMPRQSRRSSARRLWVWQKSERSRQNEAENNEQANDWVFSRALRASPTSSVSSVSSEGATFNSSSSSRQYSLPSEIVSCWMEINNWDSSCFPLKMCHNLLQQAIC